MTEGYRFALGGYMSPDHIILSSVKMDDGYYVLNGRVNVRFGEDSRSALKICHVEGIIRTLQFAKDKGVPFISLYSEGGVLTLFFDKYNVRYAERFFIRMSRLPVEWNEPDVALSVTLDTERAIEVFQSVLKTADSDVKIYVASNAPLLVVEGSLTNYWFLAPHLRGD
jgi:hypothetical protein